MGGVPLISIRNNSLKSVLAFVLLALLTPYLQGFAFLWQAGNSSCGMSCCKSVKSSCHSHNRQGAKWISDQGCPKGCGQSFSLTGSLGWSLTPEKTIAGAISYKSSSRSPARSAFSSLAIEFSLFGRPPPYFV